MAAITDVPSILNDNNGNVRKWGTQLLAIADYSTAMPDPFFDTATNKPNQLPEGFKVMGYISTDGAKMSRGIESADTSAVQDLEPVRSDITGRTRTLQLTFLEMNAWVKALAHGLPVSQWPENKDEGFEFTDEKTTEFPYYRLIWIGQDGVGDAAHYRIEAGYRVKVTYQVYTPEEIEHNSSLGCVQLFYYPAETPNAKTAIVVPGNALTATSEMGEGGSTAYELHNRGYAVFVLRYRTFLDLGNNAPLEDLARAVQLVTSLDKELSIHTQGYALVGYSSGGQLVGVFANKERGYGHYGAHRTREETV